VSYLQLLGVMLMTWSYELHYTFFFINNSFNPTIAIDFLKLFTAAVIFAIFVLNRRVRTLIKQKYQAAN